MQWCYTHVDIIFIIIIMENYTFRHPSRGGEGKGREREAVIQNVHIRYEFLYRKFVNALIEFLKHFMLTFLNSRQKGFFSVFFSSIYSELYFATK